MTEPNQYIGKLDSAIKFHAGQVKLVRDNLCKLIEIESYMVVPTGAEKISKNKTEISITLVKMIKMFCYEMNYEGHIVSLMHTIASGSRDIIKLTKELVEMISKENSKKLAQVLKLTIELQKQAAVLLQMAIKIYQRCGGYKLSFARTIGSNTLKNDEVTNRIYHNYNP